MEKGIVLNQQVEETQVDNPNEEWLEIFMGQRKSKTVIFIVQVDEDLDLEELAVSPDIPINKLISFRLLTEEEAEQQQINLTSK